MVVIGLNSGTSADGLDIAAVTINTGRKKYQVEFISGIIKKYPASLRRALDQFISSETAQTDDLIYLDQALGKFMGHACLAFMNQLSQTGIEIDLIATHGQTVRHLPSKIKFVNASVNGTLQLGALDQIATITNRITAGNFRQADIALGNEGAPITVAAMDELLAHPTQSRLIVNIGGMSNFFYLPGRSTKALPQAADCGPGNYLSDELTRHFYSKPYDKNGRYAASGRVNDNLLRSLKSHPFFSSQQTSTGVEDFGSALVDEILRLGEQQQIKPNDLIATVAALTAVAIAQLVRSLLNKESRLTKLYLTGGGVHNRFIREKLQSELPSIEVASIEELGVPSSQTEAITYAIMGVACLKARPMPTRFDGQPQKLWPVSGQLVQPPVKQTDTLDD